MNIIIVGGGTVGFTLAALLSEENHNVTLVEQDENVVAFVNRTLDIKTYVGNAATPRTLREVEVEKADLLLAVTSNDETNMVVCYVAKELGAVRTAARVRNPEYSGYFLAASKKGGKAAQAFKIVRPRSLGIDVIINPEAEMAEEIQRILVSDYSTPVESFSGDTVQLREFHIEHAQMVDKTLGEIDLPPNSMIAAVVKNGEALPPDKNLTLELNNSVYVVASSEVMKNMSSVFAVPDRPVRRVFIMGGTQTGILTAALLSRRGVAVKLIEEDLEQAEKISRTLDNVMVLNGDGSERDFLLDNGIAQADAFVSCSETDEKNILDAILAKRLGAKRVLTIINELSIAPMAEAGGVDVAGSPAVVTARKIAHYVISGGGVKAVFLKDGQLEVLEFIVSPSARIVGKNINTLDIDKSIIFAAVTSGGQVYAPPSDNPVQKGDHIIIVAPVGKVSEIEEYFK